MRPIGRHLGSFFLGLVLATLGGCVTSSLPSPSDFYRSFIVLSPDGDVLASNHPDVYVPPASCQKAITALAALKALGPEYTFTTQLYQHGDQYTLRFSGDPTLTVEDLTNLLAPLRGSTLSKPLVLDVSLIAHPEFPQGIISEDIGMIHTPRIHYISPVGAANIQGNILHASVSPTIINQPVNVIISPWSRLPVVVEAITTTDPSDLKFFWRDDTLVVAGTLQEGSPPVV